MWTPPCGCPEINDYAKIVDKWRYEWKHDTGSLVKAHPEHGRHLLSNSAFISKPFFPSSCPSSLHFPCPIFLPSPFFASILLLSLSFSWFVLASPLLPQPFSLSSCLSSPLFLFTFPPSSLYSHLLWLLSYSPKKGRKKEHELPLKNQHANNSYRTKADLPAADRSPLPHISLQSRRPYFFSFVCLLSVIWQRLFDLVVFI